MKKNGRIITGIDIGSSLVKVMVLECVRAEGEDTMRIIGYGQSESRGIERGYVVHEHDAIRSVRSAIAEAEKSAKTRITHSYLSIGGMMLDVEYAHGETTAEGPDQIISEADIERAIAYGTESIKENLVNTRVLHEIPLRITLDGKKVIGKVVGMRGNKLEVDTLVITALEQQYDDLVRVVNHAGAHVVDAIASPIAASFEALTRVHKKMGAMLVDIGAETTSVTIFEESHPVALALFPTGSLTLTEELAVSFRIPPEEADILKKNGVHNTVFPKKKFDATVNEFYATLFTTIRDHFKKMKFTNILPAGVFIMGGGALQQSASISAREILALPARVVPSPFEKATRVPYEHLITVYGVCVWAAGRNNDEASGIAGPHKEERSARAWITWLIKQFTP